MVLNKKTFRRKKWSLNFYTDPEIGLDKYRLRRKELKPV
jgi:hypothetical protein